MSLFKGTRKREGTKYKQTLIDMVTGFEEPVQNYDGLNG